MNRLAAETSPCPTHNRRNESQPHRGREGRAAPWVLAAAVPEGTYRVGWVTADVSPKRPRSISGFRPMCWRLGSIRLGLRRTSSLELRSPDRRSVSLWQPNDDEKATSADSPTDSDPQHMNSNVSTASAETASNPLRASLAFDDACLQQVHDPQLHALLAAPDLVTGQVAVRVQLLLLDTDELKDAQLHELLDVISAGSHADAILEVMLDLMVAAVTWMRESSYRDDATCAVIAHVCAPSLAMSHYGLLGALDYANDFAVGWPPAHLAGGGNSREAVSAIAALTAMAITSLAQANDCSEHQVLAQVLSDAEDAYGLPLS
jgi:hypothetical protein